MFFTFVVCPACPAPAGTSQSRMNEEMGSGSIEVFNSKKHFSLSGGPIIPYRACPCSSSPSPGGQTYRRQAVKSFFAPSCLAWCFMRVERRAARGAGARPWRPSSFCVTENRNVKFSVSCRTKCRQARCATVRQCTARVIFF